MFTITTPSRKEIQLSNTKPLVLIAGPCAIENMDHALYTATKLKKITDKIKIPFIYKSSFKKANRLSHTSFSGVGFEEGIKILSEVRKHLKIPILTDVHSAKQAVKAAKVVDILQIPSMRCRDIKLVQAAAATGRPLHIKKNEALSPEGMKYILDNAYAADNHNIALCERGVQFGYNNLVADMRSLVIMKETGAPVVFDASHATQRPGGFGGTSGGDAKFIAPLARAAVAIGIAGIFIEVHEEPHKAPCDSASMLALKELPTLLRCLKLLDTTIKKTKYCQ